MGVLLYVVNTHPVIKKKRNNIAVDISLSEFKLLYGKWILKTRSEFS